MSRSRVLFVHCAFFWPKLFVRLSVSLLSADRLLSGKRLSLRNFILSLAAYYPLRSWCPCRLCLCYKTDHWNNVD